MPSRKTAGRCDGFVEKEDLHDMLASLDKNPTDDYFEQMMNEAPGPINFTMFLTLFGERLQGTDPEDVLLKMPLAVLTKKILPSYRKIVKENY
uniref:EF-hand domain-containing protein n=1 Tax=Glossina pallidipes TaxID=7398 RepID=A0A1A9ZE11_GLOPL